MMKYTEKVKSFIDGEVFINAANGFPELFIEACRIKGITLKHINITPSCLKACVKHSELKTANDAAALSGMEIEITEKRGLPEILRKIKFRFGIPAGFAAALLMYCFFSGIIWSVEVNGCSAVPEEKIFETLENSGIKRGAFTFNADCAYAEDMLEASSPEIYTAAVNISGCRVFVDIVENIIPQKAVDKEIYSNITASRGGEIIKADIFAGESTLKKGDAVVKGDLLVSGVNELSNGNYYFCDSKACVIARTVHNITCSSAAEADVFFIKKAHDRYSPFFFGVFLLPSERSGHGTLSSSEYLIDTKRTVFPLGIIRQRKTEFEKKEIILSPCRQFLVCFYDLSVTACAQLSGFNNVERKIGIVENGQYNIEAEFICEEDICEKHYFEVNNQN